MKLEEFANIITRVLNYIGVECNLKKLNINKVTAD